MFRRASYALDVWLADPRRRPLVLRGARQVGKTWLIRDLASRSGRRLIEVNFERDPRVGSAFESNDPPQILGELSLLVGTEIEPGSSLLFLDEIQARGDLLAKLRWFFEEMPQLPVVAAGSLLEFTLADHSFSMPVGRVSLLHVEPMSFPEYLHAHGQVPLLKALEAWRPGEILSAVAHERASVAFHRYAMVGGMPAVVQADVDGGGAATCRALQSDLVATYRADFAKYSGRMDTRVLDAALLAVARSVGQKFVYSRVDDGVGHRQARAALERLAAARLCHLVRHTAANGLPLAGEVNERYRKAILVDVGVLHALLSTPAAQAFPTWDRLSPAVRGQLGEQLVGQQLRLASSAAGDGPELFCWQRSGRRAGEIDFIAQLSGEVVPIEVKSGASGAMKSLHQFMHDKALGLAVRCDAAPPSAMRVTVRTTLGQPVDYDLLSVPLYLAWNLGPLVDARAMSAHEA